MGANLLRHAGFSVLAFAALAASIRSAPHPTAVYTLDHRQTELSADDVRGLRTAMETWARGCRIVEGGAIFRLECAPASDRERESVAGEHAISATVALFRDLDETVYLAACPVLDDARIRIMETEARKPEHERAEDPELEADLRDCADMQAGRTFSVEVEGEGMRAVIRGRQLRLTIFEAQPKPRTTSTPYDAPPTKGSLGHAGPSTVATAELNPVDEPNWKPPEEPQSRVRARSPEVSLRDPGLAKTSLPTGRLRVECRGGEADIWIDEAFLGTAPLETPLPAGRHEVRAKQNQSESKTEVQLESGARLTVDVCRRP